jgi:flagellar biosynthesis protein FlhG
MSDQASQLRQLVIRATRQRELEYVPVPCIVAVAGGDSAVGTTSVAVELSYALSEQGSRVVLVDLDPHGAGVADYCQIEIPQLYSVSEAQRDIHAALLRGPYGIQVVPKLWDSYPAAFRMERQFPQILKQFQQLGRHADILVLDCGQAGKDFWKNLGSLLDFSIFVTSTLANIVTRTYTLLKQSVAAGSTTATHLLVNDCQHIEEAEDVSFRFERSCQRFLGLELCSRHYWLANSACEVRREQLSGLVERYVEFAMRKHLGEQRMVA